MKGKTSTHPADAHSRRTRSLILLTARGWATVLVFGNVLGILLKPCAMAASSMISQACRMSGLVAGISTTILLSLDESSLATSDILVKSSVISDALRDKLAHALIYEELVDMRLGEISGVIRVDPSG